MNWAINVGDAAEWARRHQDSHAERYSALLCDPPYHLSSITARFGDTNAAPAQFGADGAFARASRGFMGKKWDGGDVSFRPETWSAFWPLLKPGAFGMAFAGSRTYHRIAVAIEDGGFIIRPLIGWLYGSGFGKGQNVGDPRFKGYRYSLQILRPALEPIIVFQKPFSCEPYRESIIRHGAGAMNLRDTRIGGSPASWESPRGGFWKTDEGARAKLTRRRGRMPTNAALTHSTACVPLNNGEWNCAPDCPVRLIGEQSGQIRGSRGSTKSHATSVDARYRPRVYGAESRPAGTFTPGYDDDGTAARFFHNSDFALEALEEVALYQSKPSTFERDVGLDDVWFEDGELSGGGGSDHRYQTAYSARKEARANPHPTLKPIALIEWLAKLILPPADFAPRELLIPFSGAGSEMIGAAFAGWDAAQGLELESEYAAVAWQRLTFWSHFWHEAGGFEAALALAKKRLEKEAPAKPGEPINLPLF